MSQEKEFFIQLFSVGIDVYEGMFLEGCNTFAIAFVRQPNHYHLMHVPSGVSYSCSHKLDSFEQGKPLLVWVHKNVPPIPDRVRSTAASKITPYMGRIMKYWKKTIPPTFRSNPAWEKWLINNPLPPLRK